MATYRLIATRAVEFEAEITVDEFATEEEIEIAVDEVLEDAVTDNLSEGWVFDDIGIDFVMETSPTTHLFRVWAVVSGERLFKVDDVLDAEGNIDDDATEEMVDVQVELLMDDFVYLNPMPEGWDTVEGFHEVLPECELCFAPKIDAFVIAELNGSQQRTHFNCAQKSGLHIISGPDVF